MKKMVGMLGGTVGGWVGWWLGAHFGMMTAFMISMVGTGAGMYGAIRLLQDYIP
jgi:hypothetical protein